LGVAPELLVPIGLGLALAQQRSRAVMRCWGESQATITSLESLEEQPLDPLLQEPNAASPPEEMPSGAASLELEAVSFGYVPVQPPLIEAFSLSVQPGQRIAIVGGSASGKSSLARLIAGLLQPTAGVVKLNGRPLLEWPRQQRLQAIAMVQQGMPLLSCSVRDNLTLWNPAISQEELEQACNAAAILERIQALPQGFDTSLQEAGQNLSGGEKQRLQIAQALVQRPSLLILDEATSALDARTEQRVEQMLRQLPCTQIVVAHRLSTIRDADEILVLEQGKLVQRGTHQSMVSELGSPYAELLRLEGGGISMTTQPQPSQEDGSSALGSSH
jgi:ATP-binding cassette subfamily B protein